MSTSQMIDGSRYDDYRFNDVLLLPPLLPGWRALRKARWSCRVTTSRCFASFTSLLLSSRTSASLSLGMVRELLRML